MGNIQNSLFEAMKIFSDYTKNTSKTTTTIEGTIVEILDAGIGEYKIKYLDNIFTVYSNNLNSTYSVGDNVYVLIPDNDFSKRKIILGYINSSYDQNEVQNSFDKKYYQISGNLFDTYKEIQMSSYDTTNQEYEGLILNNFYTNVNKYIEDGYNIFSFGFMVKTNLDINQQNSGNYGVMLRIPVVAEDEVTGVIKPSWISYNLDASNMIGNPYRFEVWSPQFIIFKLDEKYKISTTLVPTITYYCEGFSQDESKKENYDIFLKNFNFYVLNTIPEQDKIGYNLTLNADEGLYFLANSRANKILTPILRYNNNEIKLKENNCSIYWFVEDPSIKSGSLYYCPYGGFGWKCLNEKENISISEDGVETFDWISNQLKYTVNIDDVLTSLKYKCVIIYKNEVQLDSTIILTNLFSENNFILKPTNNSNVFIKDTGNAHFSVFVKLNNITDQEQYRNSIIYTWNRTDQNGNCINDTDDFYEVIKNNEIINNQFETEIMFPVNQIDTYNTLYCSAKWIDNDGQEHLLGTKSLVISTTTEVDYSLIINNDNIIYKYDADGDSPAGVAYNGPSTSKITAIAPLSFLIRKPNGEEFTEEEYPFISFSWIIPKKSLFVISNYTSEDDNNYYLEGNGNQTNLSYKIANRYNHSYADSSIKLRVNFKGKVLERNVSILFTKDGEGGSNGTAYAARLVYGGLTPDTSVPYGSLDSYGVAKKLKLVYNINGTKKLYCYDYDTNTLTEDFKRIFPRVWENGVELSINDYNIEYSMFDSKMTNPCLEIQNKDSQHGVLLKLKDGIQLNMSDIYCNILQAKITVINGNTSAIGMPSILYAYYPIDLIITNYSDKITSIPSLNGGFSEVIYAPDGTNPSWDETSIFKLENDIVLKEGLNIDYADYFNKQWIVSDHLNNREDGRIVPDNKYDDGNSQNYAILKIKFDNSKENQLLQEIAELEMDNSKNNDNIQKINNNINHLTNFANNYKPSVWKQLLNEIIDLVYDKTACIEILNNIQNRINDFKEYISMQKEYNNTDIGAICESLIETLSALDQVTPQAMQQIRQLNGEEGKQYSDLISLLPYSFVWTEEIKEQIKQQLGINITLELEINIEQINDLIVNYETNLSKLKELSSTDELITYNSIYESIYSMANEIKDTDFSNYINLRDNVISLIDNFYYYVSLKELNNLIDNIYNIIKSVFILNENNELIINENTLVELNYKKNNSLISIEENNKKLNVLNNINSIKTVTTNIIRPIVFYYNRYSMSNINAWDGNKIETGLNDEYLLAPQVGAGRKNQDNSFTGIVIGQRNISNGTSYDRQIGMFGYSDGVQSLFLNADNGAAIFGKSNSGGQIIIDPTSDKGLLYSSNYFSNYNPTTGLPSNYSQKTGNGMCIDLAEGQIHLASATKGIMYSGNHKSFKNTSDGFYLSQEGLSIGSKFSVSKDGAIVATSVDLTGKITATSGSFSGKITSTDATFTNSCTIGGNKIVLDSNGLTVGGWTISSTSLSSKGITISSNGTISGDGSGGDTWSISRGNATFNKVTVKGSITAKSGNIGGTTTVGLGTASQGNNGISWDGNKCTIAGDIYANNGYFSGEIQSTTGKIGGWSLNNGSIYYSKKIDGTTYETRIMAVTGTDVYNVTPFIVRSIDSNGAVSNYFYIRANGEMVATNAHIRGEVTATSGTIGGCSISDGVLKVANANIDTLNVGKINGEIANGNWKVNFTNGTFTVGNISANNITTGTLSADRIDVSGIINGDTFTGATISTYGVNARTNLTLGNKNLKCSGLTIDGHTYNIVTWS